MCYCCYKCDHWFRDWLRALGIGPGDEVIVPDYTYPATASVVPIVGAKAIIVDVNREDMLINYQQIKQILLIIRKQ